MEVASDKDVLFGWDPVPCNKRNGKIIGFRVVVFDKRTKVLDKIGNDPEQKDFKFSSSLPCKHIYSVNVAAVNIAGTGPFSTFSFGQDWLKRCK